MTDLIAKHGGYNKLKSFQSAEIVFDLTFEFCKLYVKSFKMKEQMEGAARAGKQNISEGSLNSATSKQTEIRLLNVARGSQEELKNDILDYLRVNNLSIWKKDDPRTIEIREIARLPEKTSKTYSAYMKHPEIAGNCLLCLINQTNYLLDNQIKVLEEEFKVNGDFNDRKREVKKEQIFGNDDEVYARILKENGRKRLIDGRVVPIEDDEEGKGDEESGGK